MIREASIRYQNHSENHARVTDRAVRKLVKLFSIDDASIQQEMQEVEDMLKELGVDIVPRQSKNEDSQEVQHNNSIITPDSIDKSAEDVETIFEGAIKMMDELQQDGEDDDINLDNIKLESCKKCCCASHCRLNLHVKKGSGAKIDVLSWRSLLEANSFSLNEDVQKIFDFEEDLPSEVMDPLSALMTAVNMDLDF